MNRSSLDGACTDCRQCRSITPTGTAKTTVTLAHEAAVVLQLNGNRLLKTQCMTHDLAEMAVGFMVCEGLLQDRSELRDVKVDPRAATVTVIADIPEERVQQAGAHERLASGGSKTGVIDWMQEHTDAGYRIRSSFALGAERVLRLGNAFNRYDGLYRETRFVHSAALSDGENLLYHAEDVGRHNAVDKAVGYGFLQGIDFQRCILLCSGRFSLEMVSKAGRIGIPLYVSPAAPSVEAVELADRIGMCLVGRVGEAGAVVYSAAWRITP